MKNSAVVILLLISNLMFSQNKIEDNKAVIPKIVKFANTEIKLNGVGNRTKLWFDVYTIALYVTDISQNADEILNSKSTMGLIFYIESALINSKNFTKNVSKGLKNSAGDELWLKFQPELNLLDEYVSKAGIIKGDVYNLVYSDTEQTIWVMRNGALTGKIPGLEFKKALFGIWLSDKPVSQGLKDDLLGKN